MRTDSGKPVRLADYRAPDYLIDAVELDIHLDPHATRVRAQLSVRPNPKGLAGAPLVLDGDGLTLVSVRLDGMAPADTALQASADRLVLAEPPQRQFSLTVETALDPAANTQLMGLYRSGNAYCTQCEAEGFRRITYFLDRPDVLSIYTTRIEAARAENPVLLSNGNLVASGPVASTANHFAVWHDPFPKPCYLFALVGGDLAVLESRFKTRASRDVALNIYVEKGKEARAFYAMDALKRAMAWDERAFGCEYDLDVFNIVAVSDFNMGAMENKGLNIFNDKYVLASPQTATDADYAGIESVIAHEYFHNWTGNRITCRDWFQLCLKEGLTVFRDQEFSADERSRTVKRIADVRILRAAQFPEDAGPLAHNVRPDTYREINNFYTATVYNKGAEVIRMLKGLIGDEAFAQGMRFYLDRFDGTAATLEDFLSCFAESSGRDLGQFKLWYEQAGTPVVTAKCHYDSGRATYTIDLTQATRPTPGQPHKQPFVIPIAVGLVGSTGDLALQSASTEAASTVTPDELRRQIIELSQPHRRLVFSGITERPVASLLRGFSAAVRLDLDLDEPDLLTLIRRDRDGFNRWQATQTYATRLLLRAIRQVRAGGTPAVDHGFIAALGELLAPTASDPAFLAQVVALPSESDLMQALGSDVDPDAILAARDALYAAIGRALSRQLLAHYHALADHSPYHPDAASAGKRSLRNALLAIYAMGNRQAGQDLALRQFDEAENMTERVAALSVLSRLPGDTREAALARFYEQFESDPLVIDKWLTMHALIPEPTTLSRVQTLMEHRAFSLANPNRIRALVGAFASNQTQFNREDGSGYDFIVDMVAALDERNPQIAARLLSAFRSWRAMAGQRPARAETALQRLSKRPSMSADVGDILTRTLTPLAGTTDSKAKERPATS
jgi:aminopeptidase N